MSESKENICRNGSIQSLQNELIWSETWWHEAFPRTATASERKGHAKGKDYMHVIISYDITQPKRLRKIASICHDYGVRVQLSVFECRLAADVFEEFWGRLLEVAREESDKIVAYPLHGANAHQIRTFGQMVCADQVVTYMF